MTLQMVVDGEGLALHGDLSVDTVAGGFQQDVEFPAGQCRLDLSGVGKSDSAGLALLVFWIRRAETEGCRLIPVNAPPQMRSLLQVADLDQLLADEAGPGSAGGDRKGAAETGGL
jgi:phospholipid transport system transporter-binding protein